MSKLPDLGRREVIQVLVRGVRGVDVLDAVHRLEVPVREVKAAAEWVGVAGCEALRFGVRRREERRAVAELLARIAVGLYEGERTPARIGLQTSISTSQHASNGGCYDEHACVGWHSAKKKEGDSQTPKPKSRIAKVKPKEIPSRSTG